MWNKLRYLFINKPKRRSNKKSKVLRVPYIGPEQWLQMKVSKVMS